MARLGSKSFGVNFEKNTVTVQIVDCTQLMWNDDREILLRSRLMKVGIEHVDTESEIRSAHCASDITPL